MPVLEVSLEKFCCQINLPASVSVTALDLSDSSGPVTDLATGLGLKDSSDPVTDLATEQGPKGSSVTEPVSAMVSLLATVTSSVLATATSSFSESASVLQFYVPHRNFLQTYCLSTQLLKRSLLTRLEQREKAFS